MGIASLTGCTPQQQCGALGHRLLLIKRCQIIHNRAVMGSLIMTLLWLTTKCQISLWKRNNIRRRYWHKISGTFLIHTGQLLPHHRVCEARTYRESVSLSSSTLIRSSTGGSPSPLFCPAPVSCSPLDTVSWPRSTTTALLDCEFCGTMMTGAFNSTRRDTRDARVDMSWAAAVARSATAAPANATWSLANWNWFTNDYNTQTQ